MFLLPTSFTTKMLSEIQNCLIYLSNMCMLISCEWWIFSCSSHKSRFIFALNNYTAASNPLDLLVGQGNTSFQNLFPISRLTTIFNIQKVMCDVLINRVVCKMSWHCEEISWLWLKLSQFPQEKLISKWALAKTTTQHYYWKPVAN